VTFFFKMLDSLLRYIPSENLFLPEEKILLAVSGGLDSCIMADLFHKAGFVFAIAHCNFQLRGQESERDEQFVRQLAARYKVQIFVNHFETAAFARKHKLSIQMAARQLRYEWFDELLVNEGFDHLATAHHLDDQVETFLINLARGTGIAGLHGILPKQGKIIRPLLFATRAELEKYAREYRVPYVEDSSNQSLKYTRNRIRHKVIPQLEKINPSIRQAIKETIERVRDAESIYKVIVENEKNRLLARTDGGFKMSIVEIKKLSPRKTWLYELLADFGFSAAVVSDIDQSLDGQPGKTFHSMSHTLTRDREHLIISARILGKETRPEYVVYPVQDQDAPVSLEFESLPADRVKINSDPGFAFLDQDSLHMPLTIRKWRKGDYFVPFGMKGRKKLSDFFVDTRLSLPQKENIWLLCSGEDIVWVIGMRPDERFRVTEHSRIVLQVRWVR
jgi:tRNA(Ile)-lysidine synthase